MKMTLIALVTYGIRNDFTVGRQMNRLLMGDVGCGKTVIAAFAAYINSLNNKQTALMVPTQVLANQHFDYFMSLSDRMGFRPVILNVWFVLSLKVQL